MTTPAPVGVAALEVGLGGPNSPKVPRGMISEGWNRQGKRDQHTVGIRQGLHLEKIKPSVVEAKNIMGLHRQLGPQKAYKPSDGMERRT